MVTPADVRVVLERSRARLAAIPGVRSVGIGVRRTDGAPTGELAIRVHVRHKRPLADLSPEEVVPREIDGVPVDVVERPEPVIDDFSDEDFDDTCAGASGGTLQPGERPDDGMYLQLYGGIQVQRQDLGGRGTLGFIGYLAADPQTIVLVGNEHVLLKHPDRLVGQPTAVAGSWVATTIASGDAAGPGDRMLDVTAARLHSGQHYAPRVEGIGTVGGARSIDETMIQAALDAGLEGYPVHKRGLRTAVTQGYVTAVDMDIASLVPPCQDAPLTAQLEIERASTSSEPLSRSGDSGAAWLTRGGTHTRADGSTFDVPRNHVVGVHWGGLRDGTASYASPIAAVTLGLGILPCTTASEQALPVMSRGIANPPAVPVRPWYSPWAWW